MFCGGDRVVCKRQSDSMPYPCNAECDQRKRAVDWLFAVAHWQRGACHVLSWVADCGCGALESMEKSDGV